MDASAQNKPGERGQPHRFYASSLNNTAAWDLKWLDRETIFCGSNDITACRSIDDGWTWQQDPELRRLRQHRRR
jgi:hypothetical protein